MKKEEINNVNQKAQKSINFLKHKDKIRVLFVCLGNICRSPAAQGVFQAFVDSEGQSGRFLIDSAGTGNYHIGDLPDKRMRIHAVRRGYDLTHRARQFKISDFDDFDIIIPMDESNRINLKRLAPTADHEKKIIPMSKFFSDYTRYDYVPDPYYEGSEGFELVLDLLEQSMENLYKFLTQQ